MKGAFEIFRMTPCADLTGITLHGCFINVSKEQLTSGLNRIGFKTAVLGGNGVVVGSRDGVSFIVSPSGDFSLSRIASEEHGKALLMEILDAESLEESNK